VLTALSACAEKDDGQSPYDTLRVPDSGHRGDRYGAEYDAAYGEYERGGWGLEDRTAKSSGIDIESTNFDEEYRYIIDFTAINGGYIAYSMTSVYKSDGGTDYRYGFISARVPEESFWAVKNAVWSLGNKISENETNTNETEDYGDLEKNLESKRTEERRLMDLLASAESVEDLITIEERLSVVRAEAGILQSQLDGIDRLVSYTTINVSMYEVSDNGIEAAAKSYGGRIADSFTGSLKAIGSFFQNSVILLAAIIVPATGIAILALIVVWTVKAIRKNRDER